MAALRALAAALMAALRAVGGFPDGHAHPRRLCHPPSALCPPPSALRPLPSALCPPPSALCPPPSAPPPPPAGAGRPPPPAANARSAKLARMNRFDVVVIGGGTAGLVTAS